MKAIEQKKLAIIKSNAAPEVKLRALEKLNASDATVEKVKQELSKLLQMVGLRASVALLKDEKDLRSLEQYANLIVSMLEKMKSPKIEKVRGELRQLGVYRNSIKDNMVKAEATNLQLKILLDYVNETIKIAKLAQPTEKRAMSTSNFSGLIERMDYMKRQIEQGLKGDRLS